MLLQFNASLLEKKAYIYIYIYIIQQFDRPSV